QAEDGIRDWSVTGVQTCAVPISDAPGAIRHPEEPVGLNGGRERRRLTVRNGSGRPVRVSSHYPFWRVNPRLEFEREAARGLRLDIPAGSSVRWGPGEVKEIGLVRYGDDDEHPS